jgi:hypothetical protein
MAATAEQAAAIAAAQAQIIAQENAISEYEAFIQQEQENIVTARAYITFAESQIADETLPDAQRQQYEDNIVNNLEIIALNENAIQQNQNNITNAENQIAADQEVIAITSDTANSTLDAAPVPPTGDEALAAIDQETADLIVAAESASPLPVDPVTEALLAEQELTRQAIADEELSARLDRAADVPLTDEDAAIQAQELADLRIATESASPVDTDPDGLLAQQEAIRQAQDAADLNTALTFEAAPVQDNDATGGAGTNVAQNSDGVNAGAAVTKGLINNAQNQSTLQTRQNTPAAADWRVRLRLAPNANYLYKVPAGNGGPGILAPLAATDGVVFPYTPAIETSYQAKYANYDLTHSNYRGYFYQNSSVENITIKGTFTAQDTREAAYLLAVIHFFKSVTKMFYGQDEQAGTPPPLVYLSGFGKYQFNESPCVVTNFGYSLPTDVDYIRANGFNNIGLNMENRRNQSSGPAIGGSLGTVVAILDRLNNAGLSNGSLSNRPSPSQVNQNVTNQTSINSTYVPTKMEISITLLPMQTRNQVSKQFSLKSFANGSLLAGGGFW